MNVDVSVSVEQEAMTEIGETGIPKNYQFGDDFFTTGWNLTHLY